MALNLHLYADYSLALADLANILREEQRNTSNPLNSTPLILPKDGAYSILPLDLVDQQGCVGQLHGQSWEDWWLDYCRKLPEFQDTLFLTTGRWQGIFYKMLMAEAVIPAHNQPKKTTFSLWQKAEFQAAELHTLFLHRPESFEPTHRSIALSPMALEVIKLYQTLKAEHLNAISLIDLYPWAIQATKNPSKATGKPERLVIWGFDEFPAYFWPVLAYLAQRFTIELYCFNPCSVYWLSHITDVEPVSELPNSLLAFLSLTGRGTASFLRQLAKHTGFDDLSLPEPLPGKNLLGWLKESLYHGENMTFPAGTAIADQAGIQIFEANSPWEEVQALEYQLKVFYQSFPNAKPQDILFLSPNPEIYQAYLQHYQQIFEPKFIPGLDPQSPKPATDARIGQFIGLVDYLLSPMAISSLEKVWSADYRYNASFSGLLPLLNELGINKGLNGQHLKSLGLATNESTNNQWTWEDALKKLLVNYLYGDSLALSEFSPVKDQTGPQAYIGFYDWHFSKYEFLQNLWEGFAALQSWANSHQNWIANPDFTASLVDWANIFDSLLESFVEKGETYYFLTAHLRSWWQKLQNYGEPLLSWPILKSYLEKYCDKPAFRYWQTGSSTCQNWFDCDLTPKKAIFLLGFDEYSCALSESAPISALFYGQFRQNSDPKPEAQQSTKFLKWLLSTEKTIFISFSSPPDQPKQPAAFLQALLSYFHSSSPDYKPWQYKPHKAPIINLFDKPRTTAYLRPVHPATNYLNWDKLVQFWQNPIKSYFANLSHKAYQVGTPDPFEPPRWSTSNLAEGLQKALWEEVERLPALEKVRRVHRHLFPAGQIGEKYIADTQTSIALLEPVIKNMLPTKAIELNWQLDVSQLCNKPLYLRGNFSGASLEQDIVTLRPTGYNWSSMIFDFLHFLLWRELRKSKGLQGGGLSAWVIHKNELFQYRFTAPGQAWDTFVQVFHNQIDFKNDFQPLLMPAKPAFDWVDSHQQSSKSPKVDFSASWQSEIDKWLVPQFTPANTTEALEAFNAEEKRIFQEARTNKLRAVALNASTPTIEKALACIQFTKTQQR